MRAQSGVGIAAAVRPARLHELSDLLERESQPLRGLDHSHARYRFGRIEPVPARGAARRGQQSEALVVPQRLLVHAGRVSHLTTAHAVQPLRPAAAAARPASPSSTPAWGGGTVTSRTRRPPVAVSVKVKIGQHSVSAVASFAPRPATLGLASRSSRSPVRPARPLSRTPS